MPVIVTVDMYSGRPNPSWELSPADARKLQQLLAQNRAVTPVQSAALAGRLGYRGLIVTSVAEPAGPGELRVFDGVLETTPAAARNFVDRDSEVEQFLLDTAGPGVAPDEVKFVREEVRKNGSGGAGRTLRETDATLEVPPFNPAKWNSDPNIRANNNCYNYANDLITNTFAQPGRGSGQDGPSPPNCPGTGAAAERDGQKPISNPDQTPAEGQIIALVVSEVPTFRDYHWYRRDSDTMWSHKPGGTPATNLDNAGRPIADPRKCDRGPYALFCGFYHCVPSTVRIR